MCTRTRATAGRNGGFTIIELVIFIVVVSISVIGILSIMNNATLHSADPMARKQAVEIAESLLEEVESQSFTLCDPTDTNVTTAVTVADCASPPRGIGPAPGQSRSSLLNPFESVGDYDGFAMNNGITTIHGDPIPLLAAYNASVSVVDAAAPGMEFASLAPPGAILRITVNVTGAATARLSGYRFRYDPNAPP